MHRVAAALAVLMLAAVTALPASALGEDGPFELPLAAETVAMTPGAVTRIPLLSLVTDDAAEDLDADTAQLTIPAELDAPTRELMTLGDDATTLAIGGEGTWSVQGHELIFTPEQDGTNPSTPIALTIGSVHGSRSLPGTLTPELLELTEVASRGAADAPTAIDLDIDVPPGGAVRLELEGLPAGSTVQSDGSRAIVPDQGIWQLSEDGTTINHTPFTPGPGRQPDPIRYIVEDADGVPRAAGRVTLTVPIISDLHWSAPFGEDILFVVGQAQQHVDPSTLRLQPLGGPTVTQMNDDGTRVQVDAEGTWELDRKEATVRFTPLDENVRATAPMGIVGADEEGNSSAIALLSTAYPVLMDRTQAAAPGEEVTFDLSSGVRDVRTDSFHFDRENLPDGAAIAEGGRELHIDGEGTWQIDIEGRALRMIPEPGVVGPTHRVGILASGVYAANPVRAEAQVIFTDVVATLRDDEGRTAPGAPVTVDVLSNDTAGSSAQPLQPQTVQIASLAATNIAELDDGAGQRLVIPGEGVFTVSPNGAVTFEPAEGFTGRTTPITYLVRDSAEIPVSASLVVDVDPELLGSESSGSEVSGINSLLVGLLPSAPGTARLFGTIVMLLVFGGAVSLAIGVRMETDRRDWED
ncbi:hypothetical protein CJ197_00705 [Brachybacterium sp. UMB0905]|nr:hypothetical protein CJ197_00705 [Brachybacterium sp. UMB0905]